MQFPPKWQASSRNGFDWYKYFPNGGYLNTKSGDGSGLVSTEEYLRMVGQATGDSGYSSSYNGGSDSNDGKDNDSGKNEWNDDDKDNNDYNNNNDNSWKDDGKTNDNNNNNNGDWNDDKSNDDKTENDNDGSDSNNWDSYNNGGSAQYGK
jgi:hypothetical protein